VKTDKIDARVLADLLAAGLIPQVWIGDERCRMLRRLVSRRRGLVKRRTQVKNEIAAVMHRNRKGRNAASDPFGKKGRAWIAAQRLPIDERLTVDGCLRQLDFLGSELGQIDAMIAEHALGDGDVRRQMTIPGIDVVTAVTLAAVIGDVRPRPRAISSAISACIRDCTAPRTIRTMGRIDLAQQRVDRVMWRFEEGLSQTAIARELGITQEEGQPDRPLRAGRLPAAHPDMRVVRDRVRGHRLASPLVLRAMQEAAQHTCPGNAWLAALPRSTASLGPRRGH